MDHGKKLMVLFPGIGYTCDRPLLYYSSKMLVAKGYERIACEYSGFPDGVKGNPEKMKQSFDMAMEQAEATLAQVNFGDYDEVVFVAKSVGTVVAGAYNMKHSVGARLVLMTPVVQTFKYVTGDAIVFHGTADPWADTPSVQAECDRLNYPLMLTMDANHSMETGNLEVDLRTIGTIVQQILEWLEK